MRCGGPAFCQICKQEQKMLDMGDKVNAHLSSGKETASSEVTPKDKYKDLRDALASGPTPGPWTSYGRIKTNGLPHSGVVAKTLIARVYSEAFGDESQEAANSRHIAAANPETISALLADHDDLRNERDALREAITEYLQAQDAVDNHEYQPMPEGFGTLNARRKTARDDLDAALAQHQGEKHGGNQI